MSTEIPMSNVSGPQIDTEKTKEIKSKVDEATKTMEMNIQAATQRGESLNELQDKTRTYIMIIMVLICFRGGCGAEQGV